MLPKRTEDVGVIIGRFQTHKLHQGHIDLINFVCQNHGKVIILLGSSPIPGSDRNPLDYQARMQMIDSFTRNFSNRPIIASLPDLREDDIWSGNVDNIISSYLGPMQTAVVYGSRDSFIPYYSGRYPTQELSESGDANATNMREACSIRTEDNASFRAGMIFQSNNRYPAVITTVDIGVIYGDELILVGKPLEKQLRLPGGFSDKNSKSFEEDAIREVKEELNNIEVDDLKYLGSFNIDDWRYRKNRDKIRTMLFTAQFSYGTIAATDDVSRFRRVPLHNLKEEMIVPEHWPLVQRIKEYYGK